MGVLRYVSPKHRAWAAPGNVDRLTLPRKLLQSAKSRARKAMPHDSLDWVHKPLTIDGTLSVTTPSPPHPYPSLADKPLVSPDAWRTLPKTLQRFAMPPVDPERVVSLQPGYEGLSLSEIKENWAEVGYITVTMYLRLYVDPPKAALPPAYNVIMKKDGLSMCNTHIFGVFSCAPTARYGDPVRRQIVKSLKYKRQVALFPTHAVIWAAHCSRLPPMTRKHIPIKRVRDESETAEGMCCCRLPIVPLAIPCPERFFPIVVYVYTLRQRVFLKELLYCPAIDYQIHDGAIVGDEDFNKLTNDLFNFYSLYDLLRLAKNVFGAYQNMLALGMVDDGLWAGLDFAWQVVLKALEMADAREQAQRRPARRR